MHLQRKTQSALRTREIIRQKVSADKKAECNEDQRNYEAFSLSMECIITTFLRVVNQGQFCVCKHVTTVTKPDWYNQSQFKMESSALSFIIVRPHKVVPAAKWLMDNSNLYRDEGIVFVDDWVNKYSIENFQQDEKLMMTVRLVIHSWNLPQSIKTIMILTE